MVGWVIGEWWIAGRMSGGWQDGWLVGIEFSTAGSDFGLNDDRGKNKYF